MSSFHFSQLLQQKNKEISSGIVMRRVLLLSTILLSACAAGPDFLKPLAPTVGGYTEKSLPKKTASVEGSQGEAQAFVDDKDISAKWWKLFDSEPLNQLMERALKANPDLQAAEARLEQAKENLYVQQGAFWPAISVNGANTRQKFSSASFGQPNAPSNLFALYNASVDVSYGIDIFGRQRREAESMSALAEAERFRYEAAYLTLTSNIVTTAVLEASLREQIKETESIIAIEREQLGVLNTQFELGGIAKPAVLAQETNAAQIMATLPTLQKQLAQTRSQLAVLVGQTPADGLDAQFDLSSMKLPEELPVSLPSKLVEQRPDIKAAESVLRAANAQIGVATANMLPKITISGSYGSTTSNFSDVFSPSTIVWNLTAGVAQPVFRGGELLHRKRGAEAAYDEAVAMYKSTVLKAFGNVSDSLTALQYDAEALKIQTDAANAASKNLELSRSQYKFGGISHLELLNAQRSYQQSRIALIQAKALRLADSAALYQSLGGGWWNRDKENDMAEAVAAEVETKADDKSNNKTDVESQEVKPEATPAPTSTPENEPVTVPVPEEKPTLEKPAPATIPAPEMKPYGDII